MTTAASPPSLSSQHQPATERSSSHLHHASPSVEPIVYPTLPSSHNTASATPAPTLVSPDDDGLSSPLHEATLDSSPLLASPPPAVSSASSSRPSSIAKVGLQIDSPGREEDQVSVNILTIGGLRHSWRFDSHQTIGRVKEIIWHSWPAEWTTEPSLPPSPSYLRILFRGRLLLDDSTLASQNILPANSPASRPTIVHLSVRTIPLPSTDDDKQSMTRPPLHARASSRFRSFVQPASFATAPNAAASSGGSHPAGTEGGDGAGITRSSRVNEQRATTAAAAAGGRGDSHGGGCGCVIG